MDEVIGAVLCLLIVSGGGLAAFLVHDRNRKQVEQLEAEARKWEAMRDLP